MNTAMYKLLHLYQKKKRKLPSWIQSTADHPHAAESIHSSAPDEVFDYACAVINDGLLLLLFRDTVLNLILHMEKK